MGMAPTYSIRGEKYLDHQYIELHSLQIIHTGFSLSSSSSYVDSVSTVQ